MLRIKHAQIDPEQAVEIGELELVERAQRRAPRGIAQLLGDLPQGQAAVLECFKAAELSRRQALFQALDGLGVRLCRASLCSWASTIF